MLAHEKLTADSCKAADFNKVALMSLKKNDGTDDSVRVTPSDKIYKFSLNTFLQISNPVDVDGNVIPETTFRVPAYTENLVDNKCTCDDFLLEVHYKVYFKQSEAANSFVIESFEADLVYGTMEKKCDEEYMHTFNIKTSVLYLENKDSRKLSGSPGYLRGKPVIIGQVEKTEVA